MLKQKQQKGIKVLLKLLCKIGSSKEIDSLMRRRLAGIDWGQRCKSNDCKPVKWASVICYLELTSPDERVTYEAAVQRDLFTFQVKSRQVNFLTQSCPPHPHTAPLHHWGGEAVQSFSTEPLSRAPSGPGSAAVSRWRLDPLQGTGTGGTTEA